MHEYVKYISSRLMYIACIQRSFSQDKRCQVWDLESVLQDEIIPEQV